MTIIEMGNEPEKEKNDGSYYFDLFGLLVTRALVLRRPVFAHLVYHVQGPGTFCAHTSTHVSVQVVKSLHEHVP